MSTSISISESSSVSHSRRARARSAALRGFLRWKRRLRRQRLRLMRRRLRRTAALCWQRLGGWGMLLVLGAPQPAVSLEGAGRLAAVEPAQLFWLGLWAGGSLLLGELFACRRRFGTELEDFLLEMLTDGLCHQVVDGGWRGWPVC